jgi:hypothetical protein
MRSEGDGAAAAPAGERDRWSPSPTVTLLHVELCTATNKTHMTARSEWYSSRGSWSGGGGGGRARQKCTTNNRLRPCARLRAGSAAAHHDAGMHVPQQRRVCCAKRGRVGEETASASCLRRRGSPRTRSMAASTKQPPPTRYARCQLAPTACGKAYRLPRCGARCGRLRRCLRCARCSHAVCRPLASLSLHTHTLLLAACFSPPVHV